MFRAASSSGLCGSEAPEPTGSTQGERGERRKERGEERRVGGKRKEEREEGAESGRKEVNMGFKNMIRVRKAFISNH